MRTPLQVLDDWFPEEHCTKNTSGDYRASAIGELREAFAPEFGSRPQRVSTSGKINIKRDLSVSWNFQQATDRQGSREITLCSPESSFGWSVTFAEPDTFDAFIDALRIAREQVFGSRS